MPASPPSPPLALLPPPAPTAPARRTWTFVVRAAPSVGLGVSPNLASVGGVVAVGAGVGRFSGAIVTTSYVPASHDVPGRAGVGGTFWPFEIGAAGCAAALDRARIRSGACVGAEYERLQAEGYGVRVPGSGSAQWIAPYVSTFFDVELHGLVWLSTHIDAAFPTERPTFLLQNVGAAGGVNAVAVRLSSGVELRF